MSKSLGNGIFLSDDEDTVRKKVMSMYTDPNHIRVEDPGQIEGNMVFHYLDIFGREEDATTIAEMKEHYQRGGLGDVKTKRYLLEILERELAPIRERRLDHYIKERFGSTMQPVYVVDLGLAVTLLLYSFLVSNFIVTNVYIPLQR